MSRQKGSANFAGTLEVLAGGPLDARSIVKLKSDLTAVGSFPYPYLGMQVYVQSEGKRYTLKDMDTTKEESWVEDGGSSIDDSTLLHKDGSVAADNLTIGSRRAGATVGDMSYAQGSNVIASGPLSHAEGDGTEASGLYAHAEGYRTKATGGSSSHAEGNGTTASGIASHAEGQNTVASESSAHAEGVSTTASGQNSHAEGYGTTAAGPAGHAEGYQTKSSYSFSHAEGESTEADNEGAHAEGIGTTASGIASHAEGNHTIAGQNYQHTSGTYNANKSDTLFEIGNGTSSSNRSNAFEVYKDGHVNINGDIYQNGVKKDLTSIYRPSGSVAFADLPALSASVLGNVYDVTDAFTTTADFTDGGGNKYPAGTDVGIVNVGTDSSPSYKYNVFSGSVDLSGYQEKFQVDTLPTASADEVGKVYQYMGASTSDLTNGYFYTCIEDPDDAGNYIWTAKSVQEGSSGGSGALENELNVTQAAGGIKVGDTYAAGTTFEKLWRDLLNPTAYPTLTAPSATLTATGAKLLESGSTLNTTMTATFDRGAISPAYGTSGFRSGEATAYSIDGSTTQTGNTFDVTVDETQKTYNVRVDYAEGEQPKNSIGEDYDSPLPAGSVTTNIISYEFVDALWANTASIETVAKLQLVSKTAKQKDLVFPAQTVDNPEVFDIPASWSVTAVQVKNDLSGAFEDAADQFTVTQVTHDNAAGTTVNYNRYTFNLGYATGSRTVRIKWN